MHGYSHKYNQGHMEAHLFYLRPYLANEVKFVIYINILKGSLSATFSDVPELIVKHFVQFFYYSLGPYIPFIFSNWIFCWYPKTR